MELKKINNIRLGDRYKVPTEKRRIDVCDNKYNLAVSSFEKVRKLAQNNTFAKNRMEMYNGIQTGLEAVRQCEDGWIKDGPKQQSPL
ncbi:unnamed protein product [Arabis nemorensis]|uniref:Pectinesterase inhibitor domain-containing protein n=1 Tax=Arabis nemorensis TaxID=586526 RepID=A0A565C1Q9_9BRAS|nr:unnamed protein product [Arabis nemorensis]